MKKDDLPEKVEAEAEVKNIREKIMSLEVMIVVIAEQQVKGSLSLTKNLENRIGRMIEVATLLKDMITTDLIIGHLITDTTLVGRLIREEILQLILKDMRDHQVVIEMPLMSEIVKIEKVAIEVEVTEAIEEVAAIQAVDTEEVMTDMTEEEEVEIEVVSEVEVEEEILDLEVEVILEAEAEAEEICMILIWVKVKNILLMRIKPNRLLSLFRWLKEVDKFSQHMIIPPKYNSNTLTSYSKTSHTQYLLLLLVTLMNNSIKCHSNISNHLHKLQMA